MGRRASRVLRRLAVVVLLLVALGVGAFTWFAYWPLEGSVDRLEKLVPENVDFVYSGVFRDLKENAWVQANLLDQPVVPALAALQRTLDEQVVPQMRDRLEKPINDAIPFGLVRFSVVDDVFPGPTIVCGRFCEGWGPERNRPLWPKEWLLLTKTSWKPRFVAALKHGFVRRMIREVPIEPTDEDRNVWLLELPIQPTKPEQRAGCGDGFVIPPENNVYLIRVKDVLGFSNSKALAHDMAELGRVGEEGRSFADRPDFALQPPSGGIAAAMDLRPLHGYFIRLLESGTAEGDSGKKPAAPSLGGPIAGLLNRFLTVRALSKLNGSVETSSSDMLRARARVLYENSELRPGVRDVYAQPPGDLRNGIARLVPAADTFAVLLLQTPPLYLMQSVWEEALTPGQQDLVVQNLQRKGTYRSMDDFFRELAEKLGPQAAIAVGRISEVFDRADYPDWYSDAETNPDPFPAFAVLVSLRQSTSAKEVDEFLAKSMPALGFSPTIRRVEYRGLTYSRLDIEEKTADYRLATPAYMLVQDTLILANNEDYFRKIVDTLAGSPSAPALANDPTFLATMTPLPERAQVGLFVDLAKVLQVPPDADPRAKPRGFLWDRRNLWVIENRDTRDEAMRYRLELGRPFVNQRRTPSPQEQIEIEKQVDDHIQDWMGRYSFFLEEYRQSLLEYRRLRSVGAAFAADRDAISADLDFLVQPAETPVAAP